MDARVTTAQTETGFVKRALSGHAAIGLLAGALIYLIAITGAMIVVHDRWQRWEQPNVTETGDAMTPAAAQASLAAALALETGLPKTEHLYLRMPTRDLPRAVVTTDNRAWYIDGAGRVVEREAHSWTEFVMALHINLTLPIVWGMILVGALGAALAALLVTGVLAHPRIVRDAFRLRSRHDPQLARADWHNRLGVWTLPPMLAITLTGAFIGLSYAGAGALAQAYTEGDTEAVYATIFGAEPPHDEAPAPLPNVGRALETLAAKAPGAVPTYAVIHDPQTRGQFVQIIAEHPRRLIYGETYRFDNAGNLVGKLGASDGEIGRQAAASVYKLHFGDYGGLPVELAYIGFGIALAAITATGTTLWIRKRQRKGLDSRRLAACWIVVVWGMPLLLVLTAWLRGLGGPDVPLVASFWIGLGVALAGAALKPEAASEARLRWLLALALTGTAVAHLLAYRSAEPGVLAINLALLAMAALVWTRPGTQGDRRSAHGDSSPPQGDNFSPRTM